MIIQGLNASGNIEVVGYAINSIDAKQKVIKLKPDVMTCDVQMPGMNGIDFLKELLPQYPVPTVLVSSLNLGVFDALHAGAVDFVRKPDGTESPEQFLRSLALKVVVAA
ncbi:response regulator, partial [Clostridiaceae bacterium]|nr:response regulator [Clostridiaceae bacterium]